MGSEAFHSWCFHNGYAQPLNPKSFDKPEAIDKKQRLGDYSTPPLPSTPP